jgi:LmbE family N-acetylglucosaminyl deacetylase
MSGQLRLLAVFAHPDDETLGTGGILARYAAEGVETYLLTATRGQKGWFGSPEKNPGPDKLGHMRAAELDAAAQVLGLRETILLDYMDGELDRVDQAAITGTIAGYIRRGRPQVVVTFDPFGAYGHPDHIAIGQYTSAAVVAAASSSHTSVDEPEPYAVSKLYYMVETPSKLAFYEEVFGELVMQVDGHERRSQGWPEWSITTRVDTSAYWEQVWQAVDCHRTQLPGYHTLLTLPEEKKRAMWNCQNFYRAFSLVNGGRLIEDDLFAGLR